MLFGKPQNVVKISWAPLKWSTVGYDLKPSLRLAQVCLPLASSLLDVPGMSHHLAAAGQVGRVPTLTGWDAIRLNSLPNRALLTQLLNDR